jgi:tripartite-type tricarboxylate transporter receptor subunit TctC
MAVGKRCRFAALALGFALIGLNATARAAEKFPDRPVRLIVPFAPGGGTPEQFDELWRTTAEQLGPVIRERHITVQ